MIALGMNQAWKVPIQTLRVFEAAARWQSFHAAASELNLTPSAISHTIRKMEEALGQGNRRWRGEKDTLLSTSLFGAGFRLRNSADTSRRG
jgi:hypothetical protein